MTDKKRPTSLEATLVSLAGAGVSNKDMLEQIRKLYPDASKKDIIHAAFKTLIALRPVSESLNSWIKNHQVPHRRAPVVGHARMRVHLLFQALYLNIRATIARMLRTGQQLPFTT